MRPRKIVLLIDDDDMRRNVASFVLEHTGRYTLHYSVIACAEADLPQGQGDVVLRDVTENCAVAIVRKKDAYDLCYRLKRSNTEMGIIAIGGDIQTRHSPYVSAWLTETEAQDMSLLLERVRTFAARKRGPKSVHPLDPATALPATLGA